MCNAKKTTTIEQFTKIKKADWKKYNAMCHEGDELPFHEYLLESQRESAILHGISFDNRTGDLSYNKNNVNYKGEDICPCCERYFDKDENGTEICNKCYEME